MSNIGPALPLPRLSTNGNFTFFSLLKIIEPYRQGLFPMTLSPKKTELLAPAGSIESFFAAMEAGADAVYCGLGEFSARAKAKNFTLAEVEQMTAYCHQQDRKLYVALNTLIKEAELHRLIDILAGLDEIAIDGIILQDLGVWRLVRDFFPNLNLHASTQMAVHNVAGVKMLEKMGFTRAVLARELSVQQIAHIRKHTEIELEHFVHGALCFGISGLCLFSSFLNGTSGNRGRCAQPCRRRYQNQEKRGYYFSTNDFCAIDHLPQLIEAGVMSLKIEGRMKSAEYVGKVVGAYRLMLDAPNARRKEAKAEAYELLDNSFGRRTCKGFLDGLPPDDIADSSQQGSIGSLLGKISSVRGGSFSFACAGRLHLGDRVRILPQNDKAGSGFTVTSLLAGKRKVKAARAGDYVSIPMAGKKVYQPGDSVYRVSAGGGGFAGEASCRKKLAAVRPERHDLRLHLTVDDGLLEVAAEGGGIVFGKKYPVEMFDALKTPLSEETLLRVFSQSGTSMFCLKTMTTGPLPPVVIPPSRLKEIRRDLYQQLQAALSDAREEKRIGRVNRAKEALPGKAKLSVGPAAPSLSVTVQGVSDLELLNDPQITELILLLTAENVKAMSDNVDLAAKVREQIAWALPPIIYDQQWQDYADLIAQLVGHGHDRFVLENLGHFGFFEDCKNKKIIGGTRLYTLNSVAGNAWRELGVSMLTMSIEDDQQNIKDLLSRKIDVPMTVMVFSPVELLISRIPLRGVTDKDVVRSPSGDEFKSKQVNGLTVLTSALDFSLTGHLSDLKAMGCANWRLDLSRCGASSVRGREVLAAVKNDVELPGSNTFNFLRGLA